MSTLLSTNNDHTEEFLGDHSKLEERRDTFKRVENSIIELGEIATTLHPFFHTSLSCMHTYKVLGGFMNQDLPIQVTSVHGQCVCGFKT